MDPPAYPRCRECDLEHVFARGSCRECLRWMMRVDYGGPLRDQHAPDCSLRDDAAYAARNDAEYRRVRAARNG